jgi:sulfate/thiosulfate transport system permease protein
VGAYARALAHAETLAAIRMTALATSIAVPVDVVFGLASAWLLARFRFPLRSALVTLVDLPFSVSPVIAGLVFVLLFGARGALGGWLVEHGLSIVFAPPGIVLATLFVTFPFVAREVLPVLQAQGDDEELAAMTLGASAFQVFTRVTLPKIRWGLLYGVILATARSMGEFGAVSVVSGHIRGLTNTVPLQVEILYNEYNFTAAFAVASSLALVALATLVLKKVVEWRSRAPERASAAREAEVLARAARSAPPFERRAA